MNAMAKLAAKENAAVKASWLVEMEEEMDALLSDVPRYDKGPLSELVREASQLSGVPVSEIMGKTRKQPITRIRQYAMWKARQQNYTLEAIGHFFGRDHTTIAHAVERIDNRMRRLGVAE